MAKQIGSGAEAIITLSKDIVTKTRLKKGYRHEVIDLQLRRRRTRREYKVLEKVSLLGIGPKPLRKDDKSMELDYNYVKGDKLRDVLDENYEKWSKEIGRVLGILHSNNIIHGDLTTSNMIVNDKLMLIDFGLSDFSTKAEDKAVDLHLLKRALDSKHYKISDKVFDIILQVYKKHYKDSKEILERLKKVKKRGRNKV